MTPLYCLGECLVWRFDGSADGRANQSQTLGFRKSVKSVEFLLVGVGRLFAFYWPALPYEEYGKPIDWVQFQRFKYDPTTHIRDQTLQSNLAIELRIFNRTTSPAFFSHLKTALFDRAGVGSASE